MSTINEGLKKAQKERDARHVKDKGVLAARGKERKPSGGRTALRSSLFLVGILLAFVSFSWLDFKTPNQPPGPERLKVAKGLQTENISDVRAFYGRASNFHKGGRLEDARRLYQETLRLDPGYGDALNNLGVIYIHEKNYLAAKKSFEKAIRLKPGYVEPYYNLACLHAIKGEVRQSLAYLRKAVSLDQSVRGWARKDTDLENLSGMPEFEEIIGEK
ncbi:MAG: tetratricopeptide repeat protein [Desulfatiglandales bacterium]